MRTVLLIVIVLGLALVVIGLYWMIRARVAAAQERGRAERGDPEIIDGQARVVEKTQPGHASGNSPKNGDHAGERRDSS